MHCSSATASSHLLTFQLTPQKDLKRGCLSDSVKGCRTLLLPSSLPTLLQHRPRQLSTTLDNMEAGKCAAVDSPSKVDSNYECPHCHFVSGALAFSTVPKGPSMEPGDRNRVLFKGWRALENVSRKRKCLSTTCAPRLT